MELEDFKNRDIEYGATNKNQKLNYNSSMDLFLESFKNEIKNQRKKSFIWISVLLMLGVIYISLSVRMIGLVSIGYHLCVIGFTLGAIYFYFRYRSLPDSFYTMPVLDFIEKSQKRLNFMNLTDWLIIIPLLLILGTGGGIIFISRLLNYIDNFIVLLIIWIIFFMALSVFGFYASKKNWKKEHARLLSDLQDLRKTFGEL